MRPPVLCLVLVGLACAVPAAASAQTPTACPSTFAVLHDDRIGALALPAGNYTITVTDPALLSCAAAADRFRQFLQDYDGKLPGRWIVDAETGTFLRSVHVGFSVKPTGAPPSGNSTVGTRCGGDAFSIDVAHRFPGLTIKPGAYRIWSLGAGCNKAAQQLGRLLDLTQGRLPRGWSLIPASATFNRGGTPQFRLKLVP